MALPTDRSAFASALLDRYVLERELGRGGMAAVYLARDLKHKRGVALKVLDPELAAVVGAERFHREIETAAQLQHPHILPVFDSGEAAERLWYSMPYVEGESLRDRLRREGRLVAAEAVRLGQEIASALDYAHRNGVIHRDIKPENVLLSDGHALVADFGIARSTRADEGQSLTATGLALGTPAYMAPEQAAGQRDIDGRADIYALGCLLYECLAGRPPYTGASAHAVIAAHIAQPVPDIRHTVSTVPSDLASAIARAMAKEPADRFATAGEFSEAMARGEKGAASSSTVLTARQTAHRRARVRMAAGAVVLGLAAGTGFWVRHRITPRPEGPPRLAVLPFENLGSSDDEYFADGLADEVRGKLTQVPGLLVIARTSSGQYRRTTKSPQQIARELGVRYLLTGTVRWERSSERPHRVRVIPELLEVQGAASPTTRWQSPFETPLANVFQMQAEIASQVAAALNLELSAGTQRALERKPTQNLDAYEAYLRAMSDSGRGDFSVQDPAQLRQAIAALERSVMLDPSFAPAWAQLARARIAYGWVADTNTLELHAAAREAANRALMIDSTLPAARLAAYIVAAIGVPFDTAAATRHVAAGLAAAPSDPELLSALGMRRLSANQYDEALNLMRRAQALDPRSVRIAENVYWVFVRAHRFREGIAAADRIPMLAPHSVEAKQTPLWARLAAGASEEAARMVRGRTLARDSAFLIAVALGPDWLLDAEQRAALLRRPPAAFGGDRLTWASVRAVLTYRGTDRNEQRRAATVLLEEAQRRIASSPGQQDPVFAAAFAHALRGDAANTHKALQVVRRIGRRTDADLCHAQVYAVLGEADSARRYLTLLLTNPEDRGLALVEVALARSAPEFAAVRADPGFQVLLDGLEAGASDSGR